MIVGISCDSQAENKPFRDKFSFPFDLLCDVDKSMSLAYGAIEGPDAPRPGRISYLIDAQRRVAKVYPKVVPADHPAEVLADLG